MMGERIAAEESAADVGNMGEVRIASEKGHNKMHETAWRLYREDVDSEADRFTFKRGTLFLARRGGSGKPQFIRPFTEAQGTTCSSWTRGVDERRDGTKLRGFMSGGLTMGFCPVGCPMCFLQFDYADGMTVYGNWEDLRTELAEE